MPGYIFQFQGGSFAPEGKVDVPDIGAHNRAVEAGELATWIQGPDRWHGYVELTGPKPYRARRGDPVEIHTWLGTVIATGVISAISFAFGRPVEHVRVKGTNGRIYIGKYGQSGTFIRLRAVKGKGGTRG